MREVAHADRAATDLVLVSRTDAAPGGADLALARGVFAQAVEIAVERQDQRAVVGDAEVVRGDLDPLPFEPFDLALERPGIEHHAVADQAQRAGDDAAGQQAELVGGVAHHQRVPGVVATLEAHDNIGPARQPVDDLAFAFIAPLGADHGDIGHGYNSPPARVDPERPSTGLGERIGWPALFRHRKCAARVNGEAGRESRRRRRQNATIRDWNARAAATTSQPGAEKEIDRVFSRPDCQPGFRFRLLARRRRCRVGGQSGERRNGPARPGGQAHAVLRRRSSSNGSNTGAGQAQIRRWWSLSTAAAGSAAT